MAVRTLKSETSWLSPRTAIDNALKKQFPLDSVLYISEEIWIYEY